MLRKTIYAVATVAAIGGAALIPTEASAGGDGKGGGGMDGGMGGYHGHGHGVLAQNFHKAGKHWRISRASRTVMRWLRFSAPLFRSSPSVFAAAPR